MGKITLTETPIRAPFLNVHHIMCIGGGCKSMKIILVMNRSNYKIYRIFLLFIGNLHEFQNKLWQPRGPNSPLPAGFIFDLQYIGHGSLHGNSHHVGSSCPWEIPGHQPGMYVQPYFGTPHKGPPVAPQGGLTMKFGIVPKSCSHRVITMNDTTPWA